MIMILKIRKEYIVRDIDLALVSGSMNLKSSNIIQMWDIVQSNKSNSVFECKRLIGWGAHTHARTHS